MVMVGYYLEDNEHPTGDVAARGWNSTQGGAWPRPPNPTHLSNDVSFVDDFISSSQAPEDFLQFLRDIVGRSCLYPRRRNAVQE